MCSKKLRAPADAMKSSHQGVSRPTYSMALSLPPRHAFSLPGESWRQRNGIPFALFVPRPNCAFHGNQREEAMFKILGRMVARFWWAFIGLWLTILVVGWFVAPS